MAAADIAKCRDEYQDGEAVRERDGRIMVDAKARAEPVAVSVTDNHLQRSRGAHVNHRSRLCWPAQNHGASTYIRCRISGASEFE